MAFALKQGETIEASVKRIARGLLRRAARDLAQPDPHEAHHRMRKVCKKMRALLRLVEEPLGADYAAENQWYRDFARQLAGVRDAQAVIESWTQLTNSDDGGPTQADGARIRRALEQRRDRMLMVAAAAPSDLQEQLAAARRRVRGWQLHGDGFDTMAQGVRRGYRRAREALRRARAQPTTEAVHRWRKRAKDHWYHMRVVDCFWPEELRARTRALGALTDDLGRYHDLDVLRGALRELDLPAGERRIIDELIERRSRQLSRASFNQGAHLFAERPRQFVACLRRHHELWVVEHESPH